MNSTKCTLNKNMAYFYFYYVWYVIFNVKKKTKKNAVFVSHKFVYNYLITLFFKLYSSVKIKQVFYYYY